MRTPHPHQAEAINQLREALRHGCKRPMLQAPTGFGKTLTAAWIIRAALDKGKRVIFTVPAISLVDQTAREFWQEGIREVGIMQANHEMTDPRQPVQIASVRTLANRALPKADLVLIDEAHRQDKFITSWMGRDDWAHVPFIGLSATPWSKGLGRLFDKLIIAATTADLIERGFLSPFRAFAAAHPDLSGVKTVAGDYHEGQLSEAMQKGALCADIVTTWIERGENRPTLCFAVDCAHAQKIQEQFERAGIRCGYQDARTLPEERDTIRKQFASGELKVVCNVGTLTTGVDWDVRCIILARPTKSEILYTQIIGRGLRTAPGKADCLILDHSDTTLRLGFVTDILKDRLDGGNLNGPGSAAPDKPEPLPKECPKCQFLKPAKVHVCPSCGFEAKRPSQVEVVQGEIVELADRITARENRQATWGEKIRFMGELKLHQRVTGKAAGWVAHKYRAKYGVWPNDPNVKYAPEATIVSVDTLRWLKATQIAYAKRRQA